MLGQFWLLFNIQIDLLLVDFTLKWDPTRDTPHGSPTLHMEIMEVKPKVASLHKKN